MKFGVGVIGATGFIGTPYRSEIRESTNEARIIALCARRLDRLEAAAHEDGAPLTTTDWRAVVEHPDVNLVLVLTPDALHFEPAMACARLEKHLFCEKPVGVNSDQARQIWDAYRGSRRGHFVPFWTRYVPVFARAREVVAEGVLGDIKVAVYRWHNPRPSAMPFTWRDDATLSAAGSIADVGSHAYDTLRWIMGEEAIRVLAHADTITPAKPDLGAIDLAEAIEWGQRHGAGSNSNQKRGTTYDYANISVEFASGCKGVIALSHAPYLRKGLAPELELHGTRASLSVDRILSRLVIAREAGQTELLGELPDPGFGNRFSKHVFPAIRARAAGGGLEFPGLDDGWRSQAFTDAAAQSAAGGGWVDVARE